MVSEINDHQSVISALGATLYCRVREVHCGLSVEETTLSSTAIRVNGCVPVHALYFFILIGKLLYHEMLTYLGRLSPLSAVY